MKTVIMIFLFSIFAASPCLADDEEFSFMDSDFICSKNDKNPGNIKKTVSALETQGKMFGGQLKSSWKKTGENTYQLTFTGPGQPLNLGFFREGEIVILTSITPGLGKRKNNPKTFDSFCENLKNPAAPMQKGMEMRKSGR